MEHREGCFPPGLPDSCIRDEQAYEYFMMKLMWQSNDFPEWGGESSQPADLISSLGELISFLALRSCFDVDLKKKQNAGHGPNVRN